MVYNYLRDISERRKINYRDGEHTVTLNDLVYNGRRSVLKEIDQCGRPDLIAGVHRKYETVYWLRESNDEICETSDVSTPRGGAIRRTGRTRPIIISDYDSSG